MQTAQAATNTPRRVFVTGAGHGIGQAIVEAFVREGDRVAFCDCDLQRGQEVAQATGARFFQLDVCDKQALEGAVQTLLNEWGDLDVLVNNVGIGGFEPLTATTVEHFELILNTNLRPVFITSRLLAMHREKMGATNPYGRIVNLCSTRYLQSEAGTEAYAASKGGIWSLTHALAVSLAPYHITVNCIAPGWIHVQEQEQLRAEDHAFHLSGRVGRAEDIARTCLFLCDPKSDFINGQCITVDGGVTKKMIYPEE
ncbi:MAG: SDR family oxidoreductase [Alistipes sp.]|nr:SDR family oxidoreductase [Alistipes sp.]